MIPDAANAPRATAATAAITGLPVANPFLSAHAGNVRAPVPTPIIKNLTKTDGASAVPVL